MNDGAEDSGEVFGHAGRIIDSNSDCHHHEGDAEGDAEQAGAGDEADIAVDHLTDPLIDLKLTEPRQESAHQDGNEHVGQKSDSKCGVHYNLRFVLVSNV